MSVAPDTLGDTPGPPALPRPERPSYSIVVPIRNEEHSLPELERRLVAAMDQLDGPAEVLFVEDGSTDRSYEVMLGMCGRDPRFKLIELSRDFGHQLCLSAGLDLATGDAVISMDGDLQHPPELIPEMVERWKAGYDVVVAIRGRRGGESLGKRISARLYYGLLKRFATVDVHPNAADFRLLDRAALDALTAMRESHRYLRSMVGWVGFRQTTVDYDSSARFAGETKYTLGRLLRLAGDGITGFSTAPLRFALHIGAFVSALALVNGLVAVGLKLTGAFDVPGWASIAVITSFLGGVQLIVLGIIGTYVGRIYEEVKGRPVYIVRRLENVEPLRRPSRAVLPPDGASRRSGAQDREAVS